MVPTALKHLSWMMASVVYPADADDYPEIFLDDYDEALEAELTETQERYVGARLRSAKFIEKLFAQVILGPSAGEQGRVPCSILTRFPE